MRIMIKEVNVHPVLDELNKSLDFLSKHKGLTLLITNLSTNFTMDLFINYLMSIGYDEYYVVILDRYSDNYITASTFQASVLNRYSDILKNDGIDLLSLEDSYLFTTDYKHILTLSIFDSTFSLTRDTYIDFTKYLNDINSKLKEGVNQVASIIMCK